MAWIIFMLNFIVDFFYGWYVYDSKNFWRWVVNSLKYLDRDVALIGNLQNWTSPLFGDYSYIGRVAGPILRTLRIIFGAALYGILIVLSAVAFLIWLALPMVALAMVISNLIFLINFSDPVYAKAQEAVIFIK